MATRANHITDFSSGDPLPLPHGLDGLPGPLTSATLYVRRFPTDTAALITKTITTTHVDGTGTLTQPGQAQIDGTWSAEAVFELIGGPSGDTIKMIAGITYWYEVHGLGADGVLRCTELYCTISPRQVGPTSF